MTNELPDNIVTESLERLRQGEDAFSVSQSYGDYANELLPLLQIADAIKQIPKQQLPTPHKQFRFAETHTMPYVLGRFFSLFRVAVIPISLVLILFGGHFVVQAAEHSLPGDLLYSLKRASETAQLNLTFDQQQKANLHVELTQKRLNEVKQAFDTKNPETEAAAIAALKDQAEKTFAKVPQVAVANALTNKNQDLLNNLVAINKEQKSVLTSINATDDASSVTTTALNVVKENSKTLAKIIATVNEQTLADLPNKISITGDISSLKDNKITVEKNTFLINDQTFITNVDGSQLDDLIDLTGHVTIVGTKSGQGLIAKQISMLAPETTPTATVPTPTKTDAITPTVKGTVTTKPSIEPAKVPPTPETTSSPEPQPINQATGSFIIEPNTDQYAP